MPAVKAVLRDYIDKKLNPAYAYRITGKDGRIATHAVVNKPVDEHVEEILVSHVVELSVVEPTPVIESVELEETHVEEKPVKNALKELVSQSNVEPVIDIAGASAPLLEPVIEETKALEVEEKPVVKATPVVEKVATVVKKERFKKNVPPIPSAAS